MRQWSVPSKRGADETEEGPLKRILHDMRLNLVALLVLVAMVTAGSLILRNALLRSAQSMGTALSRNYAAEESNNLCV